MQPILNSSNRVGIISCSDGHNPKNSATIENIEAVLQSLGLQTKIAKTLYQRDNTPFSGTPMERGQELMELFTDSDIKAIIDISGGDTANQLLPYLDFHIISMHPKPFFGISDLSVLLNAIYACAGLPTYHFKIATMIGEHGLEQINLFKKLFLEINESPNKFSTFKYSFLRGNRINGTVIGGNMRCFLKLAGTPYLPDPNNKVLFLESLGGGTNRMASLLAQLEQIGYFKRCNGIILGTFTELESKKTQPTIEELTLEITTQYQLPIIKTNQLGHGSNGHCLPIGLEINL